MKKAEALTVGKELDEYLRFRAAQEDVGYEFTPEFFAIGILKGCKKFFGITYNKMGILADEEQPNLFSKWKTRH